MKIMQTKCPGCGVELEVVEGPTDPYQKSSPACWALYGRILIIEASDPAYFKAHRLTVDAYMAQHPSNISRTSIQSVWVHLVGLYLMLERKCPPAFIVRVLAKLTTPERDFDWLTPPASQESLTIQSLIVADSPERYYQLAKKWALSVWNSWSEHHNKIRALAEDTIKNI